MSAKTAAIVRRHSSGGVDARTDRAAPRRSRIGTLEDELVAALGVPRRSPRITRKPGTRNVWIVDFSEVGQ